MEKEKIFIKKKKVLFILGFYIFCICLYYFFWDLIYRIFFFNIRGKDGMKYVSYLVRDSIFSRLGFKLLYFASIVSAFCVVLVVVGI